MASTPPPAPAPATRPPAAPPPKPPAPPAAKPPQAPPPPTKTTTTMRPKGVPGAQPAGSTNYRETFFAKYPALRDKVFVHHAIEQQVLKKYPGLFTEAEIHSLKNLRGIPPSINSQLHLSNLRLAWNRFCKSHPTATKQDVLDFANFATSTA